MQIDSPENCDPSGCAAINNLMDYKKAYESVLKTLGIQFEDYDNPVFVLNDRVIPEIKRLKKFLGSWSPERRQERSRRDASVFQYLKDEQSCKVFCQPWVEETTQKMRGTLRKSNNRFILTRPNNASLVIYDTAEQVAEFWSFAK